MGQKVLVVEDEPALVDTLEYNLARQGYDVAIAMDGATALSMARSEKPDLVILDVMLPVLDGFEVCRILRQETNVPILMLTARVEEVDKVVGLEVGADDYVTKPFSIRELLARIKAHLRREKREEKKVPAVYLFDDVEIDFVHFKVKRKGMETDLTSIEMAIMKFLISHCGEVVTRAYLLDEIWGYEKYPTTRTIDNHILKLRKKIEKDPAHPEYILSVYGEGYRFMGK